MSTTLTIRAEAVRRALQLARGRLRAGTLRLRGARLGRKVVIGSGCRIDRPFCLAAGDRVTLEDRVFLKIVSDDAVVEMGERVFLGRGVEMDVLEGVRIGSHTLIAPDCFLTDHNHGVAAGSRIDQQESERGVLTIGSDVWLGTKVVVLPGVTIGDGAVVGASSVVVRDVPPMAIVAGIPAVPIGTRS